MQAAAIFAFLETNWSWSAALAGSMLALTALASALLNPARKEEIALWLMGAHTEQSWSRSFVWLFDALFGDRHLSWHCFLRSAIASLIAVILIWFLIGGVADLEARLKSELSLRSVLFSALAINVIADYVSLLETRWLLGRMQHLRSFFTQVGVLVLDLIVSAVIIWLAILAYLNNPLYDGEVESFAEILGVFSVFSVIFYSTFLTSVWSWAYILSTWVMRLFRGLRLPYILNVEHRPILILGHVLAVIVFVGSMVVAPLMQKGGDDLSIADRALCSVFKGQVCLEVAKLTEKEQTKFDLILLACEGGVTDECLHRGADAFDENPLKAARFFRSACEADEAWSCTALGLLYESGNGVNLDLVEAARLFRLGCQGGVGASCSRLGEAFETGIGVDPDLVEAARLFRLGCEGDDARACTKLGMAYLIGSGVNLDLVEAARNFSLGCQGDDVEGCTALGMYLEYGMGVEPDPVRAARLFRLGCEGDDARACTKLGRAYLTGRGVNLDLVEAARLFRLGCGGAVGEGCALLGMLYREGSGVEADPVEAARLFRLGCEGGYAWGCTRLGALYGAGSGVDPDPVEATRFFRFGCEGNDAWGCSLLAMHHELGIGMEADSMEAARLFRLGCEGNDAWGCMRLGMLYGAGSGVDLDHVEAARLFRLGCNLGSMKACELVDFHVTED